MRLTWNSESSNVANRSYSCPFSREQEIFPTDVLACGFSIEFFSPGKLRLASFFNKFFCALIGSWPVIPLSSEVDQAQTDVTSLYL